MSNEQPTTQTQTTQAEPPRPEKDFDNKPIVPVCSACEWAGEKGYEKFQLGADAQVVDEIRMVHKQVQSNTKKYSFTHGTCEQHIRQSVSQMPHLTPQQQEAFIQKAVQKGNLCSCLLVDAPLRHAFARGLFTKEEIENAAQQVQQSNNQLTERFKKLAGIIK